MPVHTARLLHWFSTPKQTWFYTCTAKPYYSSCTVCVYTSPVILQVQSHAFNIYLHVPPLSLWIHHICLLKAFSPLLNQSDLAMTYETAAGSCHFSVRSIQPSSANIQLQFQNQQPTLAGLSSSAAPLHIFRSFFTSAPPPRPRHHSKCKQLVTN